jgi:hypothetical protein
MDGNYMEILRKLSLKYKKPVNEIKNIVESQFEFSKQKIEKIDFTNVSTEEEFNKLKTNFNFKYLFNFSASFIKLQKVNKIKELRQKENEIKNTSNEKP